MSEKSSYDFREKDAHWSQKWVDDKTFATPEGTPREENLYVLDMFPYPSGSGLHVGHPMGYVGTDIYARMRRMQGKNVLHPMGYDAFGLPAEQHAIKTGEHPSVAVATAVASFRKVMQDLGLSYDWDREINTTDPDYYKWTQWIFGKLFERGLAYMEEADVNWCPELGTVLANEEVIDGVSERGGFPVEKRPMKQWVLKITAYADRLIEDLNLVDWPEGVKEMQRNWIGKSEGLELSFDVDGEALEVFTTRPDTLHGVTYVVIAPEHPLVKKITTAEKTEEVEAYTGAARNMSDRDRTSKKDKSGVFTGAYAINPVTGEKVQVWVGDYVLGHYGKGAVMGVPDADERDAKFAEVYGLESKSIFPEGLKAHADKGILQNSGTLDGMTAEEARAKIMVDAEKDGFGKKVTNYKLRDWIFSRQRYWGEPFPIIHRPDGEISLVDTSEAPVLLPDMKDYKPSGKAEPMLEKATDWVNTPEGRRETNTMPQWAGSCWYYLRFIDPNNTEAFADPEKLKAWLPVDKYIGGTEHAVLHLLYARFWHKVLFDAGLVPTPEPFNQLINQGMILGEDGDKMSKSKGNTVAVADVLAEHGADVFRAYEMFLGAFEKGKSWNTEGINGVKRWLERVWSMYEKVDDEAEVEDSEKAEVQTFIKGVTDDIAAFKFNTAIAKLMVLTNKMMKMEKIPRPLAEIFCKLIAPFAPMISEEIWCNVLKNEFSVHKSEWPEYDETMSALKITTIAVQINGKLRDTLDLDGIQAQDEEVVTSQARLTDGYKRHIEGKEVDRTIFVPGKVLNVVTTDAIRKPKGQV
jgi:leucyl-tRNA synthetase